MLGGTAVIGACSSAADPEGYAAVAAQTWRVTEAADINVEVGTLRPQFAASLGLGGQRPDLVVRFGRGPRLPQSLRRPVRAVLV